MDHQKQNSKAELNRCVSEQRTVPSSGLWSHAELSYWMGKGGTQKAVVTPSASSHIPNHWGWGGAACGSHSLGSREVNGRLELQGGQKDLVWVVEAWP